MNPRDQNRLLREVFADDALDELREDSLARGLAATRARGQRRRIRQTCAMAAVPALVFAAGMLLRPASQPQAAVDIASSTIAAPNHDIKSISDAELLALFPGRSVGLIGTPGHQQLVFFDEPVIGFTIN